MTRAGTLPVIMVLAFIITFGLINLGITESQDAYISSEIINLQNYIRLVAIDEMEIAIEETLAKEKVYFITDDRKPIVENNIRYYIEDYLAQSSFYSGDKGNLNIELYQGEYQKVWSAIDQKWFYLPITNGNKIKVPAVKIEWEIPFKTATGQTMKTTIKEVVSLGDGFY